MASYTGTSITTELIQKYLDENKQLILAILDNQNLGKLNESATYKAKLQQNLMYLAAIADAQPQGPPPSQAVAANAMPAQQQYMQQQQMSHQSILGQRTGTGQYLGQGQGSSHQPGQQQQQQTLHGQPGMISAMTSL